MNIFYIMICLKIFNQTLNNLSNFIDNTRAVAMK